jgi:hypothetical protein
MFLDPEFLRAVGQLHFERARSGDKLKGELWDDGEINRDGQVFEQGFQSDMPCGQVVDLPRQRREFLRVSHVSSREKRFRSAVASAPRHQETRGQLSRDRSQ